MPRVKRRGAARRLVNLADISEWEQFKWGLGQAEIEGHGTPYRPGDHLPAYRMVVWRSWAELFEFYERVREDYLATYWERWPGRTPGIEGRFLLWQQGKDPEGWTWRDDPQDPRHRLYARYGDPA